MRQIKSGLKKTLFAAKLFEVMKVSVADINAQNLRMHNGQKSQADIERHANAWIKAHQKTFDGWVEQARSAAITS